MAEAYGPSSFTVVPQRSRLDIDQMIRAGQAIGQLFGGRQLAEFARLLKGVELGLVDPNEAMTRGTPGAAGFERFFGVPPPQPVTSEEWVIPGREREATPYYLAQPELQAQAPAVGQDIVTREAEPERRETRRRGGFPPRDVETLKRHIIKERMAGRAVDPQLEQYAGFAPKTFAQLYATDPALAREIQELRNDPRREAAYERLVERSMRENPTATPEAHARFALAMLKSFKTGKPAEDVPSKKDMGPSKGEMISDSKRRMLEAQKHTSMFSTLVRSGVGVDVAAPLAEHMAAGGSLDDFPLAPELRKRIDEQMKQKQTIVDARMLNAQARAAAAKMAGKRVEQQERKLDFEAAKFQKMHAIYAARLNNQAQQDIVENQWKVIAARLRDPATRVEAEREALEFGRALGMVDAAPDAFSVQGLWEWIGRSFAGEPGWGRGGLHVPPFNPPKVIDPKAPPEAKPKTADDLYRAIRERSRGRQ